MSNYLEFDLRTNHIRFGLVHVIRFATFLSTRRTCLPHGTHGGERGVVGVRVAEQQRADVAERRLPARLQHMAHRVKENNSKQLETIQNNSNNSKQFKNIRNNSKHSKQFKTIRNNSKRTIRNDSKRTCTPGSPRRAAASPSAPTWEPHAPSRHTAMEKCATRDLRGFG